MSTILGISGSLRSGSCNTALLRAAQAFDEQGELQDEAIREQLRKFVAGFAAFAGG